jgi:hypothetical protein
LKYFIPYLIVLILLAIAALKAMVFGFLVFIIGIFFAMLYISNLYFFILPILMVEGPNIRNAIGRTYILAHKRFWPNMGWIVVFTIIVMVISIVLTGLILFAFTGSFFKVLLNPEDVANILDFTSNPIYLALSALSSALYLPLVPIFAVILYFNGKAREEDILSTTTGNNEPEKVKVEDLYPKPKE